MYNQSLLHWYKTKARNSTTLAAEARESGDTQLQLYFAQEASNYTQKVSEIEKEDKAELAKSSSVNPLEEEKGDD